jgi:ribosomal protein L16 Arg81 hydroxylase
MDFDQVIAPLTRKRFLAEHWNKSFLRMKGKAGRFAGLLGWGELNAILEQHRLAPPRFKLVQDGKQLDPSSYLSAGLGGAPRLDSGKLVAALAGGATLILDSVQEMAPRVRDLSESFREALHSGNYVNLYAGWHSQNGFDLHWDSQDTIILQLSGRKRWQLFEPTRLHPLQDDVEAPARPTGPPHWDGIIEDGDAIYIPRGWWHMAFPLDEPSLHLTFATVPPNGMDLLRWLIARLPRHVEARRNLPAIDDTEGQAARLAELRALLAAELHDGAIADFHREWVGDSFPSPHVRLPGAPYEQLGPIGEQSRIRLAAAHRLTFATVGDKVEFKANGKYYVLPADLVPALELLTDTKAIPMAELGARLDGDKAIDNLKKALAVLARAGIVLVSSRTEPA